MAEVRYIPATEGESWRAAVSPRAIAVLAPTVTPPTAEAVWRRLDGGGIGALVEALTGAFGTSLTAIPPFALVVVEDEGVRVAVRGPIDLLLEGAHETLSVSGRGVATWAERLLPNAQRITVSMSSELDEATSLPIASGIVLAAGVVLSVDAPRAAAVAPEQPVPRPVPIPVADEASAEESSAEDSSGADTWIPANTQAPITDDSIAEDPNTDDLIADVPVVGTGPADDSTIAASRPRKVSPARASSPPPVPPIPAPSVTDAGEWASTVVRPPASDASPTTASPTPTTPPKGDHDGATISVAEARAMRGEVSHPFEPVGDVPPRQPSRGRVRLSNGRVVELERPVVIGRRPRSTRASGAELPTLIAVDSPEGDISRSHVEIRAEGEHVLVTDLATTNGTVLRRVGQDPVRLHPNEPTMVVTGDVLDLGDGVTVAFEDLP